MTPERWRQIDQLYHAALERDAGRRAAFLDRACAGDAELRREVESLLASHERAGGFIAEPALKVAAQVLAGDQAESLTGRTLAHYKIVSPLGAGGMGEVYLAEDVRLGRRVALKLLPAHFTRDGERLRRFEREARAASSLNHPNVCVIHEVGEAEGGRRYIVMEYVEGTTLRHHTASARMKLSEVLDIAIQVAGALARAHQAGIVHRDVKPENIMVRSDGIVKVLDFGLAKLVERPAPGADTEAPTRALINTDPGAVLGTALYMSPEQVRALDVDPRADVWSLGVVLYELVAGRAPFEGATTGDVIAAIIEREPPPLARFAPGVPHELERIVTKALAKDREERYQTVKDLLIDLKALRRELEFEAELDRTVAPELREALGAATRGGHTSAATAQPRPAPTAETGAHPASSAEYIAGEIRRHKRGVALGAAALAVVIVGAGLFVYLRRARALTERDTILLADFVNTTGDAVFDGTLKQALAVQLGQSPFLNIYSDERVREALRFMGRSPDERVTRDVAREICERQGLKALLAGSISALGSHYVVTLEAVNARTGDALAREQAEAESKEKVLASLGAAATRLREKLGESLGSIQKFDAPVEQATTSSLEALKAFSLGNEQYVKGAYSEAIPFYKRAAELDPNFALAYARLAAMYFNTRQPDLAEQFSEKAYELRDRVSERERFYIESHYYVDVVGDVDKNIETLELWRRTYPRDHAPLNNLALQYLQTGQLEKAGEAAREAMRLNPNNAPPYTNLGWSFVRLNRFDEAKAIFEQALAQKLESGVMHIGLFWIGFAQGDAAAMQRQVEWATGKPGEPLMIDMRARAAANSGRSREAREFTRRAVELAQRQGQKELVAQFQTESALKEALFGNCRQAKEDAAGALAAARSRRLLAHVAFALSLCGGDGAQPLVEELTKRFPQDSNVNTTFLPTIRAAVEINRGDPAQAIQLLETARRYELGNPGAFLYPAYVRGLAYLRQRNGAEAAAEFQKILEHRGVVIERPLYALAHLGLARAAALTGDTATSRKAYQDFLALWKDADPGIPVLIEAKKEYEQLK